MKSLPPAARVYVSSVIGLGVVFNGVYLLTSIGLNITKSTKYYPVATAIAAGTSIGGNFMLVPRFGAVGSAFRSSFRRRRCLSSAVTYSRRARTFRAIGWPRTASIT